MYPQDLVENTAITCIVIYYPPRIVIVDLEAPEKNTLANRITKSFKTNHKLMTKAVQN